MPTALRIVHRNALVYRRIWRGSLFMSFLQPSLFLASMGLGLGGMMREGSTMPGGMSYVSYLAPGLLASTCMQTAAFESSFPIMGKMTWRRNYDAMSATPLSVVDIVVGELLWIGVRLTSVAAAFLVVLWALGVARGGGMVLAVPAAVLTGLAFAAPVSAYAATLTREGNSFNVMFRFVITPLFLCSGVFFPVSGLPAWLQAVVGLTPLYHGVELMRGLVLGSLDVRAGVVHVAYLTSLVALGGVLGVRAFRRKLYA
jgi:lipooligosaccharide transport system permease protein